MKRGTTINQGKGVEIKTGDDGFLIEGWYENGKFDGPGRYYSTDGNMYEGGWKECVRHGKGKLYYKDGRVVDETWENGVKK